MGPIEDRTREHLGTTDKAIIELRYLLLDSIADFKKGIEPRGVDPKTYRAIRAGDIVVPMDDTQTKIFFVRFDPSADGSIVDQEEILPVEYVKPYKNPPDALHPFTRFRMDEVQAQDHMAWETQGSISDRTAERLATADRGIVMLREMMRREIGKMKQGLDPLGVMRDPNHAMIDSELAESLRGPEYRRELRDVAA